MTINITFLTLRLPQNLSEDIQPRRKLTWRQLLLTLTNQEVIRGGPGPRGHTECFQFLSETKALKQNYKISAAATQVLESQYLADRAQMLISKMTAEPGLDRHP